MTANKSFLYYARLSARIEDFMSLRGLPSALFRIYTCVVLRLFFILCELYAVKNKFPLPYLAWLDDREVFRSFLFYLIVFMCVHETQFIAFIFIFFWVERIKTNITSVFLLIIISIILESFSILK